MEDQLIQTTEATNDTAPVEVQIPSMWGGGNYMMYIWIAFMAVIVVGGFAYSKFKAKQFSEATNGEGLEEFAQRHDEILKASLGERGTLFKLGKEIREPVLALTSALPIKSVKGELKDQAKTLGKQMAWAMVGVKATYYERSNAIFLLLGEKNIHYVRFIEGNLSDHITFEKSKMMNKDVQKLSTKDQMLHSQTTGYQGAHYKKLTFEYEGQPVEIIFMNWVMSDADAEGFYKDPVKSMEMGALGQEFEKKIQEYIS